MSGIKSCCFGPFWALSEGCETQIPVRVSINRSCTCALHCLPKGAEKLPCRSITHYFAGDLVTWMCLQPQQQAETARATQFRHRSLGKCDDALERKWRDPILPLKQHGMSRLSNENAWTTCMRSTTKCGASMCCSNACINRKQQTQQAASSSSEAAVRGIPKGTCMLVNVSTILAGAKLPGNAPPSTGIS